jgi:hypothetical protein
LALQRRAQYLQRPPPKYGAGSTSIALRFVRLKGQWGCWPASLRGAHGNCCLLLAYVNIHAKL